MMKEREEQVRAEYEKLLSAKLAGMYISHSGVLVYYCVCSPCADQYDAFVKFNHDQVERRLKESDFSCKCRGWALIRVCTRTVLVGGVLILFSLSLS